MRSLFTLLLPLLLAACAAPKYTVDDGRKVDESLLANIRAYGSGEQSLRPAIVRSATLKDPKCDRQWELPFAVATSYGWAENDRVAWVRGLNVDERLTVVAAAPNSTLNPGDKLLAVAGKSDKDSETLLSLLADARDAGKPFFVTLSGGASRAITPFEVCRGYARLAPPNTPEVQDYHWLLSMHSLELSKAQLSEDEALWAVLWTQGLSEEGGARMKTYHYGTKIVGTLYNLATLATGLHGAALAAEAAVSAAKVAAKSVASEIVKQQLIEQGRALAAQRIREGLIDAGKELSKQQVMNGLQAAAANRSSLSGVAWIASTVFDQADQWAFERAAKLGADPLAAFSLHQKLLERSLAGNAFALDIERLEALSKLAQNKGLDGQVQAILRGFKASELALEIGAMPLASAPTTFSYESASDPGSSPFARGLIDAMLDIPTESSGRK
ncbi:hypothetical protein LNV09_05480 [Paucibacter sp. B2R-40]|uniref:hypothetical protein n=1 Tax=Paucibacter sp. B2R-40 TaxID=2893554 RepID=UPI0021E47811|nr:hypothetical protein [Paucibacter sp. B2R-40]MCV2353611.1 hypothetical protein [Paucibacter sp. B2R-40]